MQESRYTITPTADELMRALDAWQWLDLEGKTPILASAFGDIFLEDRAGIWYLDTLQGQLQQTHATRTDLFDALCTPEGQEHYLLGGLVDRAIREGKSLGTGQCYDFKVHPALGGAIDYDNVEICDFVVAVDIRGQIHEQTRHLPQGTRISGVKITDEAPRKPWWKLW